MRVLIVPSWYPHPESPTAGIFVMQQARALASRGVDVAVLFVSSAPTSMDPEISTESGVLTARAIFGCPPPQRTFIRKKIAGLKFRLTRSFSARRLYWRTVDLLEDEGFVPDVIHVHALWPAMLRAKVLSRRWGVPIVVTEHSEEYLPGSELPLLRQPLMLPLILRPLAAHAQLYIAVSSYFAAILSQLRMHPDIRVVPNIVPDRPHHPFPTGRGKRRIVHVSHFSPAKNISLLIDAVEILHQRRDDFVLDLVGTGPGEDEIRERVILGGLEGVVEFRGRMAPADVSSVLDMAHFAVLSSRQETFSVFAAEALMAGRPVVTTDCGGPVTFIEPQVGRVVPNFDSDALAQGMDEMLDVATTYSPEAIHEYAVSHFSEDAVVPQLVAAYHDAIRGYAGRRFS